MIKVFLSWKFSFVFLSACKGDEGKETIWEQEGCLNYLPHYFSLIATGKCGFKRIVATYNKQKNVMYILFSIVNFVGFAKVYEVVT